MHQKVAVNKYSRGQVCISLYKFVSVFEDSYHKSSIDVECTSVRGISILPNLL